ncbi:hypothetical protein BDV96DRAFT_489489 [Lophiotrema nucula]|uniref:Glycosyl transferase CAP10 domain-containing protein n=1 Tax=Lophiotrema nucula TaxID=690887 RepID=A0A6A5ZFH4_9PLEO|nr:hypothetical protein BDV96DRAFT_489489 [Lophiotrema nucula]
MVPGLTLDGKKKGVHPIDILISDVNQEFQRTLSTEATSLEDASKKYRKKRRRHPPPGFDAWYEFATQRGAVVVEEFWDQIYHDLGPFWGIEPRTTRSQAHALSPRIQIRGGNVTLVSTNPRDARTKMWVDMLKSLAETKHVELPDVDIPINVNQEPALVVGWEKVDTALSFARPIIASVSDVLDEYSGLKDVDHANFTFAPEWLGARLTHSLGGMHQGPRPYWSLVQPACPPKSPSRTESILVDIWHRQGHTQEAHSAVNLLPTIWPNGTLEGYIGNWSTATDACLHPHLQGLHGAFVQPDSMAASQHFFPYFSGGKMSVNNDILFPSPLEWNASLSSDADTQGGVAWESRETKLLWRGPATGGHNTAKNWRRFQRHRFVSMLNSSQIALAENSLSLHEAITKGLTSSETFRLPDSQLYNVPAQREGRLGDWVASWTDVGFTDDLHCEELSEYDACPYDSEYFSVNEPATAEKLGSNKYTVALDGNGDDGTDGFVSSMKSGHVVLRASVFRNWYDTRLRPWVHYVPMDNTFMDVYGIMEYFVGNEEGPLVPSSPRLRYRNKKSGHAAQAQKIATAAQEWADKVLRKEDMLIYVYRLLLEYARIGDDRRERLGWVGDLSEEGR